MMISLISKHWQYSCSSKAHRQSLVRSFSVDSFHCDDDAMLLYFFHEDDGLEKNTKKHRRGPIEKNEIILRS